MGGDRTRGDKKYTSIHSGPPYGASTISPIEDKHINIKNSVDFISKQSQAKKTQNQFFSNNNNFNSYKTNNSNMETLTHLRADSDINNNSEVLKKYTVSKRQKEDRKKE